MSERRRAGAETFDPGPVVAYECALRSWNLLSASSAPAVDAMNCSGSCHGVGVGVLGLREEVATDGDAVLDAVHERLGSARIRPVRVHGRMDREPVVVERLGNASGAGHGVRPFLIAGPTVDGPVLPPCMAPAGARRDGLPEDAATTRQFDLAEQVLDAALPLNDPA